MPRAHASTVTSCVETTQVVENPEQIPEQTPELIPEQTPGLSGI